MDKKQELKSQRPLNRDAIKYIAIVAMTFNHAAKAFMGQGTVPYEVCTYIGYIAAPLMCFFLVEGYHYTHSKLQYALRLLIFAAISELPFCMVMSKAYRGVDGIAYCGLNMMFTLFLCFIIVWAMEDIKSQTLKILIVFVIFYASTYSDWALTAPLFTLFFQWAGKDETKIRTAFVVVTILVGIYRFTGVNDIWPTAYSLIYALKNMIGPALAGIIITVGYNGKRIEKGRNFSKWFFYVYYPLHLAILGALRLWVLG